MYPSLCTHVHVPISMYTCTCTHFMYIYYFLIENYHTLYDKLSHLKITCLEKAREEAKQRNRTNQQEYVITCLGKPLEKLSSFFEGVERLLASGVKAEQIGFYRDYSKGELVKCIQAYPGKEVRRYVYYTVIMLI